MQTRANATKERARSDRGSATSPPSTGRQSFSEKLGSDLSERLVKDPKPLGELLSLVGTEEFSHSLTAKRTTTTTTTTITSTAIKEEEVVVSSVISKCLSDATGTRTPQEAIDSVSENTKFSQSARNTFDLHDFAAVEALKELIRRYGRVCHMGILDRSYTFFVTNDRKAALCYKVKNKIAVVGGDPLCKPGLYKQILSEFAKFRKASGGWGISFLGSGGIFVEYAKQMNWTTMCFGTERVLNPMTNPVLHGNARKSITRTNKNLMDPNKEGITLEVYKPRLGRDPRLEEQLVKVYEKWRDHRNGSERLQAYITVYDPFSLPDLMTYLYTKDRNLVPNGFAALRLLGANNGYHIDPCVAAPGAPKGITDLLIYGAMALLSTVKISYLSLGYEPLEDIGEITGMSSSFANISRKVHRRIYSRLPLARKKDYHDKFRPDETQQSNLYLVFPPGVPSLRHMAAVVHVANIKIRDVVFGGDLREKVRGREK